MVSFTLRLDFIYFEAKRSLIANLSETHQTCNSLARHQLRINQASMSKAAH